MKKKENEERGREVTLAAKMHDVRGRNFFVFHSIQAGLYLLRYLLYLLAFNAKSFFDCDLQGMSSALYEG